MSVIKNFLKVYLYEICSFYSKVQDVYSQIPRIAFSILFLEKIPKTKYASVSNKYISFNQQLLRVFVPSLEIFSPGFFIVICGKIMC